MNHTHHTHAHRHDHAAPRLPSLMQMSASRRLSLALVLLAVLWGAVYWALESGL